MVEYVTQHPSGGYILDELHVGMAAEKTVHVTEDRIRLFAEASDDFNPVHLDAAFASKTAYRGRIAHGLLSAAFGSAVVGTILPGAGSIYISQTLAFHFPVQAVTSEGRVRSIDRPRPATSRVSSVTSGCPSVTDCPSSTSTFSTVPVIWLEISTR